jgi:NIMA (never in mitosis gene a)-related kinase
MVRAYERLRHISTGRFGAAYLIQAHGRLAMMKSIDIGRLDSASRKQVVEEVAMLANLRHPHIIAIRECFVEGSHLCVVMQYAEGGHAAGQIEKACRTCTPISEPQIMRWFTQAVLGLKHLHDKSVVHRDLRTRRLLLTGDGNVVLSNAAVTALLRASLHPEKAGFESTRYLSPELVAGEVHTQASDMWALGVILYELAALSPPFEHSHPRGLAERILSSPPRMLPSRCSKDVRDLCSKLLQRKQEDRLSSTAILGLPTIQDYLHKLFNSEPAPVPGATCIVPPSSMQAVIPASPRKGFGHLLQTSPALAPRGLRCIGEHVTGIKCGSIGTTGTTALRGLYTPAPSSLASPTPLPVDSKEAESILLNSTVTNTEEIKRQSNRLSTRPSMKVTTKRAASKGQPPAPVKDEQTINHEMASEHAKVYAGIMVETALEELNFSSSRLLEEDVPLGRFSLPTAVDNSEVSWHVDKEVVKADAGAAAGSWNMLPAVHSREFPHYN